jgi:hypothetical protein
MARSPGHDAAVGRGFLKGRGPGRPAPWQSGVQRPGAMVVQLSEPAADASVTMRFSAKEPAGAIHVLPEVSEGFPPFHARVERLADFRENPEGSIRWCLEIS